MKKIDDFWISLFGYRSPQIDQLLILWLWIDSPDVINEVFEEKMKLAYYFKVRTAFQCLSFENQNKTAMTCGDLMQILLRLNEQRLLKINIKK